MKNLYLSLVFGCFFVFGQSQIELVPNPSDINSGIFTLKYGELGDYSIFDPQFDPNLYIYTGLQTDSDPATWDYHDDFDEVNTLIPLTFDTNLGYYVATFNPATRTYLVEPSLNEVSIPEGLQVFDWYFLIRNLDGSRQSADLKGSDYGFGPAQTLSFNGPFIEDIVMVSQDVFTFSKDGRFDIEVYNILGKRIKALSVTVLSGETISLNLKSKGVFILRISSEGQTKVLKTVKY